MTEVNDDVPYKVNKCLPMMHMNQLLLQQQRPYNKMLSDHNDDENQKNEMEYIHVDDDDHAMMR